MLSDRIPHSNRALIIAASVYVALVATNALTFWRSVALPIGTALAVVLIVAGLRGASPRVAPPGRAIVVALVAWAGWSAASLAWSQDFRYTLLQVHREIVEGTCLMVMVYVAAQLEGGARTLAAVALAAFTALAAIAVGMLLSPIGWQPSRYHAGVGPYATNIVSFAPLMLMLIAPRPVGFGNGLRSVVVGALVLVLLVATARHTDNRMVWIALAVSFATAAALGALRWRGALVRTPLRWAAPVAALALVLGVMFVDAARERALVYSPQTSVADTIADDPRLALWDRAVERIGDRPWMGYGFGRAILGAELRDELHDPTLTHAHNLFISQMLQTGAIGLAAFVALLSALFVRYARFYRSRDDAIALIGLMGIALLAGFVVKNLTDDFLFRASAKTFWALNALLIGWGAALARADARATDEAGDGA